MGKLKSLYKTNKINETDDLNLNKMIDEFLTERQEESMKKRLGAFHPSILANGIPCPTWWYYFLTKEVGKPSLEVFPVKALGNMLLGTAIHDGYQELFYDMGILEGMWKCLLCGHTFWDVSPHRCENCKKELSWTYLKFKEVPLVSDVGGSPIRGHADGIFNVDGERYFIELKSIKSNKDEKYYGFEKLDKPMENNLIQFNLYIYLWSRMVDALDKELIITDDGLKEVEREDSVELTAAKDIGKIEKGKVIYINKNEGIRKVFTANKNEKLLSFIITAMEEISTAVLNKDTLEKKCTKEEAKEESCRYRNCCYE